jgi:hypothetical protein
MPPRLPTIVMIEAESVTVELFTENSRDPLPAVFPGPVTKTGTLNVLKQQPHGDLLNSALPVN